MLFACVYAVFAAGALVAGGAFLIRTADLLDRSALVAEEYQRASAPPKQFSIGVALLQTIERAAASVVNGRLEPTLPERRITVLLLGADGREGEDPKLVRTDAFMLLTLDPINRTAGVLSIPRDLWVTIPSDPRGRPAYFTAGRINEAFRDATVYRYPGGGLELAKKTVRENLGIHVDYAAMIDFHGFERLIDGMGGVEVEVPKRIVDNEYPTHDYGYMRVVFEPGWQRLDGVRALQYARTRHADNDFERTKRQQQIMNAMRERALRLDVLPRLPQLANDLAGSIETDLPAPLALALLQAAMDLPRDSIAFRSLEPPLVYGVYYGGASLQELQRNLAAPVIGSMFYDPLVVREGARVRFTDASGMGLQRELQERLAAAGWTDTAWRVSRTLVATSAIYDMGHAFATTGRIADVLGLPRDAIVMADAEPDGFDVEVVIGRDLVSALRMARR